MSRKWVLAVGFLLFLPVVEAAIFDDFFGSFGTMQTISLVALLVFVFVFIGYMKRKPLGDMGEQSAVGGVLGNILKWPFVKGYRKWMERRERKQIEKISDVKSAKKIYEGLRESNVSGKEENEMHDELLSDAVLKKAAEIGRRVNRWEIGRDKLMQASGKNIEAQIAMMVSDLEVLTQMEVSFSAAFKHLQARKRERLPYDKKAISQLYREKRKMGVKLKELVRKLSVVQEFYDSLKGEAQVQMDYDEKEKELAEHNIETLHTMVEAEQSHIEGIRKLLVEDGGDKQLDELRKLAEEKEELTGRILKIIKEKEGLVAEAENEEKKLTQSVAHRQKGLNAIRKLASELYNGTQGYGAQLSEQDIVDISEEIRRKIPDLYPNAHKTWFHFEGKGIKDRTEIMRNLHEKLEEIDKESALQVENKDKILQRIKRLFPDGDSPDDES